VAGSSNAKGLRVGSVRILEAVANIAIALTLLWPVRTRIGAILSAIPRRYALFSITSLVVLIGAQAAGEGEALYPLTDWGMYTTSLHEDHRYVDYTAELSSGRQVRLLIGRIFPAGGMYLRRRIDDNVDAIEAPASGSIDPVAVDKLDAMLAAIARKYDTLHPGDPVRTIRLWRGTVSLRDDKGTTISRRLIYEYHAR
jgi:hypothetical protein